MKGIRVIVGAIVISIGAVRGWMRLPAGRMVSVKNAWARMAAAVPETEAVAAPAKKLRVGVIGAGRIGQVHAENLAFRIPNAQLAAVASGTKQLADRCSLTFGCQPYYDYHELLEDDDVDAIIICSASGKHVQQVRRG